MFVMCVCFPWPMHHAEQKSALINRSTLSETWSSHDWEAYDVSPGQIICKQDDVIFSQSLRWVISWCSQGAVPYGECCAKQPCVLKGLRWRLQLELPRCQIFRFGASVPSTRKSRFQQCSLGHRWRVFWNWARLQLVWLVGLCFQFYIETLQFWTKFL